MNIVTLTPKQRDFLLYVLYSSGYRFNDNIHVDELKNIIRDGEYNKINDGVKLNQLRRDLISWDPNHKFIPVGSTVTITDRGHLYSYWDDMYEKYNITFDRDIITDDAIYKLKFKLTDLFVHDKNEWGLVGVVRLKENIKVGLIVNVQGLRKIEEK